MCVQERAHWLISPAAGGAAALIVNQQKCDSVNEEGRGGWTAQALSTIYAALDAGKSAAMAVAEANLVLNVAAAGALLVSYSAD